KEIQNLKGYAEQMIEYLERFILQQNEYLNEQIARQKVIIETIEKNALSYIHIEEGIKILSFKPLKDLLIKYANTLENLCKNTEIIVGIIVRMHKIITYRQKKTFTIESYDYVGSKPVKHQWPIAAVSISKDETLLATTAYDDYLKIWNLKENKMVTEVNLNEEALHVCFSNCQNYVYLGLSDGKVKKLQFMKNEQTLYQIHDPKLYLSENKIATSSIDYTIRITQLQEIDKQIKIKTRTVDQSNIEYSQKNNFLLSIDRVDLCLWDADSGIELLRYKKVFPYDGITQTYLSPSESRIASICEFEQGVRLFRFIYDQKLVELEHIHYFLRSQVYNISWGLDDNTLVCTYNEYFYVAQLDCEKKMKKLQLQDNILDQQYLIQLFITPTFNYLLGLKKRNLIYKNEYQQNHVIYKNILQNQRIFMIWPTYYISSVNIPQTINHKPQTIRHECQSQLNQLYPILELMTSSWSKVNYIQEIYPLRIRINIDKFILKIKYEIQELRTSLKAFAIKKKNIIQHNRKANNLLIFLFQFLMIQDNVKTCNRHQNQDSLLICLRQECLDKDLMCQKCLDEGKHNTCFQTDKVIQLKSLQNIIIGKNQRVKDHLQELEQIQKQLNLQIESICQYLINNIQTRLENYMNFVKQLYSNSEQFIANMGENYFNEKLLKFSRDSWLFEIQKDSLQVIQDVLNQFENLLPENLSKTKEQIQFSTYFVTPQEQRIDIKLHQNKYQVPIKSSIKEIAISQDSNYIFLYLENKESQILSQQNTKIIHRWQNDQIITFAAFSLNNRDLFLGTSTGTIQKFVVTENYCDKTWNLKCNADSQITQIIQLNSDMLLTESNFDFFQINDLNSQKKLLWKYQKKKKISSNIIMTSLSQILIFQDDLNILFFDTNFMNLSLSMKLENIKEHKIFLMKYQPYDMDEYLLLLENNNRIKIYSFNKDLKSIIQVQNVNLHVSIEKIFYIKSKDILVLFQAKSVILSKVTVDEFKIIREIKDLQYDFNILKKSDNFIGILMKNKQKINKKLLKQSQQIIFDGQYQNEETVKYQNALKKLIPFINHEKVENVDDHLWAFRSTILGNVSIMEQNLESFSRYVETIKSFQDHAQRLIEYLDKFIKQQNEYFKVQISKQKDLIQLIEKNSLNSINIEEGIEHLKYEPLKDASFCEIMEIFDLVCEKLENICYYTQAQYDKYCKKGDQHHFTEHTLPTFRPQQTFTIESYDYWPIAAVSISKDETLLATTAYDDYLKIWNLKENKMVTEVNLNEEALHVCFSNCQNYVYLGLSDGKVKKLQFMKNEQTLYQIHDPKLYLSENKIATSSIDYTIRITQLQEIDKQIKIKTRTVDQSNIEYSQKNNFLLSIDRVDLCLWDADSGIELLRYKKVFPYDGITQTYLSPSESRIASICEFEQGVRLFRFIYDQKLVELEHIHYFLRSQVYNISWGLDDNTLVCTYNEYFYVAQLDCEKKMKKLQLQDNILDQQYLIQLFITPTFNYLLGLKKRNLIYKNEYQQNHVIYKNILQNERIFMIWPTYYISSVNIPQTINHKPQTINHKPQTINHKPQTINHKPQTINHKPQTINTKFKNQNKNNEMDTYTKINQEQGIYLQDDDNLKNNFYYKEHPIKMMHNRKVFNYPLMILLDQQNETSFYKKKRSGNQEEFQ
ncbi:hypothetical protein pb186bvf_020316, partial [Paramecium bursaria]